MPPDLQVFADADSLAAAAADRFCQAAAEAVALRDRFAVALAGGSTPERLYSRLAEAPYRDAVPWDKTVILFGDERMVPWEDPRSNYAMARRSLLDAVPIPAENVHPVDTRGLAPDAAACYESLVRGVVGDPPAFDLILLGLGDDGHTASLFPGQPALQERARLAVACPPGVLPPPVERVTLTFPVLNAARLALFLVTGERKAAPLAAWLSGTARIEDIPAAGISPTNGALLIFSDKDAAKNVRIALPRPL